MTGKSGKEVDQKCCSEEKRHRDVRGKRVDLVRAEVANEVEDAVESGGGGQERLSESEAMFS